MNGSVKSLIREGLEFKYFSRIISAKCSTFQLIAYLLI